MMTTTGNRFTPPAEVLAPLQAVLRAGKLHHAYLFEGPVGAGKRATATALAQRLQCESPARDSVAGCGSCAPCLKVADGTHPDVTWVDMTPKGLTDRVRELLSVLAFRPYEGRARVLGFDPAQALAAVPERAEAANALLKSLEEPPADTYFFLLTSEPRRLPATIRSRCQRLRFSGLAEAAPAEGAEEERSRREELWSSLTRALAEGSAASTFAFGAALAGDREQGMALLETFWRALRAALLTQLGLDAGRVQEEERRRAAAFDGWPPVALERGMDASREAVEALRGNVAPALVMEQLVFGLREVR